MVRVVAGLLALLWLPGGAWAESSAPTKEADNRPDVTVEADRATLERRVNSFVSRITARPSTHESMARWNADICPLVAGLPSEQGEFVLRRLSEIARSSGAQLGSEQCHANLYVLVASGPQLLLKKWRKKDPYIFGVLDAGDPRHAPPAQVDRFMRTERPVRVWYNNDIPQPGNRNASEAIADLQGGFVSSPTASGGGIYTPHLAWDTLAISRVVMRELASQLP